VEKAFLVRNNTRFIKLVSPASSCNNIDVASCVNEMELCISAIFKIVFVYWKCHIKGIIEKIYDTKKFVLPPHRPFSLITFHSLAADFVPSGGVTNC
jgi:hypothetical protein